MPIRVILADDHPIILHGLENLLRLERDFQVLASCTEGVAALQKVRQHKPDVLILDIFMPGIDGLEVVRQLRKEKLSTRVVILTAALDEEELLESIRLGVQGVVLKEMAPQLLVKCIRKVHAGGQWIEPRLANQALEKMVRRESGEREMSALLTPREIEIVRMVARSLRNKEIAEKLFISEGTVKIHLHNIYEKLNVDGRLALLRYVQEKGLV
jgi:DNA-binding NarL/FixJ family response regulator